MERPGSYLTHSPVLLNASDVHGNSKVSILVKVVQAANASAKRFEVVVNKQKIRTSATCIKKCFLESVSSELSITDSDIPEVLSDLPGMNRAEHRNIQIFAYCVIHRCKGFS